MPNLPNQEHPSMRILCFLGVCSMINPGLLTTKDPLHVVMEWTQVDYDYSSPAQRNQALNSGNFIPLNNVIIGTESVHIGNETKYYITVPRFVDGIPATLSVVKVNTHTRNLLNPKLTPYPSWDWHSVPPNCGANHLVSVFRTWVDECGHLWVLDTGKIQDTQLCPAQIITFDTRTDQVINRFEIPSDQMTCSSLLITPVVDVRDPKTCKDVFVYVADVNGYGLIVYDVRNQRSWRINHNLFYPYPTDGHYVIAGEEFNLMDGVFALALSPLEKRGRNSDRILYFHSLASVTENIVSTSVIRNEALFLNDPYASFESFHIINDKDGRRPSQATAEYMDKNGNLFFGLTKYTNILVWDSRKPYSQDHFKEVAHNEKTLQFASDVRVKNKPAPKDQEQDLLVVTCRFQKIMAGTLNPNEVNFRIQIGSIRELMKNAKPLRATSTQNHNSGGGGYGLVPRPQAQWGGIFADKSYTSNSNIKRDTTLTDRLVFH